MSPRFPLFISLEGRCVFIIGGGAVAARRARVLLDFGARITVISPELCDDMCALANRIQWQPSVYAGISANCALIIAATNNRETNRQIGADASKLGIPVSVADSAAESTFWFPAVMRGQGLVAGMTSENADHGAVKRAAQKIRQVLEETRE